jgi:glutamate synthase domain-containing protein 1
LAHPYRYLTHNGEINTLGEIGLDAGPYRALFDLFGDDLKKLFPILTETGSDSATIDNALEFLIASGRSLPHAIMMLIPEAWNKDIHLDPDKQGFYEYHACMMEPWDGPAAIAFTDGRRVGAVLDRNGLRPARYVVTKDGLVVMASEVGVLDIPQIEFSTKGRLQREDLPWSIRRSNGSLMMPN